MSHIGKPNELERIASSAELEISSSEGHGPDRRWTPIWVVRVDDGGSTNRRGHHHAPRSVTSVWVRDFS
jgi:hypothetical protein